MENLVGRVFDRLTVLRKATWRDSSGRKRYGWWCQCDCGNVRRLATASLKVSKSCGCYRKEFLKTATLRHGGVLHGRPSRTYESWKCMVKRCTNPNAKDWYLYGGRGVKVCRRWRGRGGFGRFVMDMGERPKGKTLDRYPDPHGDYDPDNCRWATPSEQQSNRRSSKGLPARA